MVYFMDDPRNRIKIATIYFIAFLNQKWNMDGRFGECYRAKPARGADGAHQGKESTRERAKPRIFDVCAGSHV